MTAIRTIFLPDWQYTVNRVQNNPCAIAALLQKLAGSAQFSGSGHHRLLESAVEAARARFRPILMTSFAFILGVVPLVLATGAGASARKSIGITVFSGMIASTCLAVLFVPTFFVVVQRFENWLAERKRKAAGAQTVPQAGP
jgi:Cu/Ag efflux pump CusA